MFFEYENIMMCCDSVHSAHILGAWCADKYYASWVFAAAARRGFVRNIGLVPVLFLLKLVHTLDLANLYFLTRYALCSNHMYVRKRFLALRNLLQHAVDASLQDKSAFDL